MNKQEEKQYKRFRRKNKIRAKIQGTTECPRLSVFKSNRGINLQVIDDSKSVTIVSANSKEIKSKDDKSTVSFELGKLIAKKCLEKKIEKIVFDRGGNKYHGRVKMVADGAREGGLKF